MTETVTLRAGWALWGKQPGTRQDYSVLACSPEPFNRADYAAIIARFAVGSPDASATGPGALPWATVSWVGVDNDPQLGISIATDSGQLDGVGRPITQTAYFCVPYAQLERTQVSYCDLYDAVARLLPSLRPEDGPAIQLAVPGMSADRLAGAVHRAGEQTAAAAAAQLLTRPVSVVQADGTTLRDRLEFIDAVTALLPYGYRVRFSGATWSDPGSRHRVRLAFAARPLEGAAVMHWRRGADLRDADPVTAAYYDKLGRLMQDPARAREGVGPSTVISHLAADTEPRTFERPQEAIQRLSQLSPAFRIALGFDKTQGSGSSQATVADLREIDAGGGHSVRQLLETASREGNLDRVLPAFTEWLAGSGELRTGDQGYWVSLLAGLAPLDPRDQHAPESRAWLDTALLAAGGTPSGLPPAQEPATERYAAAMAEIWAHLRQAYPTFDIRACVRTLTRYLSHPQWTTGAEQANAVVALAGKLQRFDNDKALITAVASALAATPAARDWKFAGPWIDWAARHEPEAVQGRRLEALSAPPSTDPDTLARLCAEACTADIDVETALRRLAQSGAVTEAAQAGRLILLLPEYLRAAGIDDDRATEWKFRLGELLARGEFGTEFLGELRERELARARRGLRVELSWLAMFAADGADGPHEWTDAERKELSADADYIESLLKQSGRGPSWWNWRR